MINDQDTIWVTIHYLAVTENLELDVVGNEISSEEAELLNLLLLNKKFMFSLQI